MTKDFLAELLDSPSRARVLRTFILNEDEAFTPQVMAKRAKISLQGALKEMYMLEKCGLIEKARGEKKVAGTKKGHEARILNQNFKYLRALSIFVHDVSPVEQTNVLDSLKGSGRIELVILSGTFMGDPSRPADILIAGESLSEKKIERAVKELEPDMGRELRYATFTTPEFRYRLTVQDRLIREVLDFPHRVLLNRVGLV